MMVYIVYAYPRTPTPSADPSAWSDLKLVSFEPKTFGPEDVELAITHCGVCGSDVHVLRQSWGAARDGHTIAGHEIIGKVTRVGALVKGLRPGDRVGVGGGVSSCGECRPCKEGFENYCQQIVLALVSGAFGSSLRG